MTLNIPGFTFISSSSVWRRRRPRRAVILNREGTLVEAGVTDPRRVTLVPTVVDGLQTLHRHGFALIVIANEAGVAHGIYPEYALYIMQQRLRTELASHGIPLTAFYYCPHHPEGRLERYSMMCLCRKPAPGLLMRAAREHEIQLEESWLIGDVLDDIESGKRAGCRTILLDNGREALWKLSHWRVPTRLATDLTDAVESILAHQGLSGNADATTPQSASKWTSLFGNLFKEERPP
jgi:histidinol-phosphate phosphatase family protein